MFAVVLATLSLGLLSTATVSASPCNAPGTDRGWPTYNPASLSGADCSLAYPPGGSSDYINTSFSSSIAYPIPETWVVFNGTSDNAWVGCCPFNPDTNGLADSWWVSGVAISVSVPLGIGFSGSGGGPISYGTTVVNWWQHHNFSGVQFNGAVIYQVWENACTSDQFGYDGEHHCTTDHSTLV